MKNLWKISYSAQAEFMSLYACSAKPQSAAIPLLNAATLFYRRGFADLHVLPTESVLSKFISLFADRLDNADARAREDLRNLISPLKDDLLKNVEDSEKVVALLEEKGISLFRRYTNGSAFIELLKQLASSPYLLNQVFSWRRKRADCSIPMTSLEYVKGIAVAGRQKNIDLATELFAEAADRRVKTSSTYNALMSVYMMNGFAEKCQSLFHELKDADECSPTIVTYNILLSVFGRLMLIDNMEATFKEIQDKKISPNVMTYNTLIAGYITAWMWNSMEKMYTRMKADTVKPDLSTKLLMLRGYAHSGNLEKMEEMYALVKHYVDQNEIPLIRAMICSYSRSSDIDKIKKIEALLCLIPEHEYRPWLNVILITAYAKEDLIDRMEASINEAFEHNTVVNTTGTIRYITASYYRNNAVDRLAKFVKQAECYGWKLCRSLYHCKMCLYASQNRLTEMEKVLDEMESMNFYRSKKTFWILHRVYSLYGLQHKVEKVKGLMCKCGYGIPSTKNAF